ncbi:hypothetical protein CBP51_04415 [Cellvibrio mixtus]|uniref:DUF1415 domain-containing protein n=1 Tax=Cellvibrio mixtus TaxID=39650 RepID=A0A266Q9I2_9GAMM|nr:hypothetical protein CBP51_04415 [Cellvibrio mixtus]
MQECGNVSEQTSEQSVVQSAAQQIKNDVARWLNSVVIGLNLCPFAAKPTGENRVRLVVSAANDDELLLQDLQRELELLDETPASALETTLLIIPQHLQDFFDYNQFLNWAEQLLKRNRWTGIYQLATFHPDYCFSGAAPEDAENLTNRSPYPILHIIREASLEKALAYYDDIDAVPDNNKACMEQLTQAQKQQLFPYLFNPPA